MLTKTIKKIITNGKLAMMICRIKKNIMQTVREILNYLKEQGMCDDGKATVDNAMSVKDVVDAAFSAQGIEFLANLSRVGKGVETHDVRRFFSGYINGNYTRSERYDSQMYFGFNGFISCEVTLLYVQDCTMRIVVPKHVICEIYVCGSSNVTVDCKGEAVINRCGKEKNVIVRTEGNGKIKIK